MSGHFRVEVNELDQLLRQLNTSQEDMRTALNAMKDVGPKSTGSEVLDNACDEFHDSWDDAIEKIADGVGQIEDKLKATRHNYAATEEAIRDAFHDGEDKQPTPQSRPTPSPQATPAAGAR